MKTGIGIDTGGTYTDAVIYDFDSGKVLSSAKSLTTKEDLSLGISAALDLLDAGLLRQADFASLSTTLATNACVEGKGGRAKLLFIGQDGDTLGRVGADFGLRSPDEVFVFGRSGSFDGKVLPEVDWDELAESSSEWLSDAESLGIVETYAVNNGAAAEREAKERFSALRPGMPIVCSSELFSGLNSVRRGAGTLLNARLIPVINAFLAAIERSFGRLGISCPVMIVRSDGSLMSRAFSRTHPVETILCGPASSVLGGMALAGRPDSIIVDMGGTTTDISLVKGGRAVRAEEGISIGGWRTFVKGVFIDTFALGGDSAVRCLGEGFDICADRAVPLSLLASRYPYIKDKLRELLDSRVTHTRPLHEFFTLVRDIENDPGWSEDEKALCRALKNGPLILRDAAEAVGREIYTMRSERLEAEGVILRSGLTPTDIMQLTGDFAKYDADAAALAARFLLRCMGRDDGEEELRAFCGEVYERIKKTLYCAIVRILLQNKYPALARNGLSRELRDMIASRWEELRRGEEGYFDLGFTSAAALVGIGAPTHIFLPDVAKALSAECVIPPNAGVANAVGAVSGSVSAFAEVEVRPDHNASGVDGYFVCSRSETLYFKQRGEAVLRARELARRLAVETARERGISAVAAVDISEKDRESFTATGIRVDLGTVVTASAIGGALL